MVRISVPLVVSIALLLTGCIGLQISEPTEEQLAKTAIGIAGRRVAVQLAQKEPDAVDPIKKLCQKILAAEDVSVSSVLLGTVLDFVPTEGVENELLKRDIAELMDLIVVQDEAMEKYIDHVLVQTAAQALLDGFMIASWGNNPQ